MLMEKQHSSVAVATALALGFFLGAGLVGICWWSFGSRPRFVRVEPVSPQVTQIPRALSRTPQADRKTAETYRGRVGQSFLFNVTGALDGPVWGTQIYTDDSHIPAAAVHAGLLRPGEKGVVRITILPGQETYRGSNAHGVSSSAYGRWSGSIRLERVIGPTTEPAREL
jgi:hypothetical protein